MYIMFETIAGNDPRRDPKLIHLNQFWHLTIGYIAPENEADVYTKWLNGEVISKDVAEAAVFCTAHHGEMSVLADEKGNIANNKIIPTSYGDPHYKKATYFLTDEDKKNAIECMKAAMRIFTNNHCPDESQKTMMIEKINSIDSAAADLDGAQMFMATYFEFDTAYTNGKPRSPEFKIDWVWN